MWFDEKRTSTVQVNNDIHNFSTRKYSLFVKFMHDEMDLLSCLIFFFFCN